MRVLRNGALVVVALALAASAHAQLTRSQTFGVGASGGIVESAETHFSFSEFERSDVNVWGDYELEEHVVLRATLGRMHVAAHNAGQPVKVGDATLVGPEDMRNRIDYGLVSTSYDFVESAWTSGLFGGVGIYGVKPGVPAGELAATADKEETAFGLHFGVDAQVTVWRTLAVIGRVTAHFTQTDPHRTLVTADLGAVYRF